MVYKRCRVVSFAVLALFFVSGTAATVDINGTVFDSLTHKGIAGATVALQGVADITATTDAAGKFTLSGEATPVAASGIHLSCAAPSLKANVLTFFVGNAGERTLIELYNVKGARVATLLDKALVLGRYSINPSIAGLPDQFYFVKISIGNSRYTLKCLHVGHRIASTGAAGNGRGISLTPLHKTASLETVDTIIVSASTYRTMKSPISGYAGTMNFTIRSAHLQGLAHVISVSPKGINGAPLAKRKDTPVWYEPEFHPGFINAGAPDYLTVQLKKIFARNADSARCLWDSTKTIKLTGAGTVDVGDIVLDNMPTWKITQIELWFNDTATICGTLNGIFNMDSTHTRFDGQTKTYYTKAAYAYYAGQCTGGADTTVGRAAAFETAPAESSAISLQAGPNGVATIWTPASFTYDTAAPAPSLTLLFDLSRVLRFYNGCDTRGPNGGNDSINRACFFCFSVFSSSVGAFFGVPGKIQGYESVYNCSSGNCGVRGWMTMIFGSDSSLLSGILIPNNDNDFTISKGLIDSTSGTNSNLAFHYNISNVDVVGFSRCIALGDSVIGYWTQPAENGHTERTGEAKYILRFMTN